LTIIFLFREGLSRLLKSEPDFAIAGNCGTPLEVLQILQDARVEMILLDFDIGDHGGQFIVAAGHAGYGGKILMVTAGMSQSLWSI
jgi:DNA-binding NarL/FixJ family response regulator